MFLPYTRTKALQLCDLKERALLSALIGTDQGKSLRLKECIIGRITEARTPKPAHVARASLHGC